MGWMTTRDVKGLRLNGTAFRGVFLLRSVARRTAKNGRPFLTVEVCDRFGGFSCNVFDDGDGYALLNGGKAGQALEISGTVDFFNDRLSPRIISVRPISAEEIQKNRWESNLFACPREPVAALRDELTGHIGRITREKLRRTVHFALEEVGEEFFTGTAAMAMHHAYRSGLLEHTVHVTRAGVSLLPHYPFVDSDLAITGMVLHDIGKVWEYRGDGAYERTAIGLLEGHVVLGYRIVRRAALRAELEDDLTLRLEHIILSHQGLQEYGAAVPPSSPEGVFVAMVDNLDARMAMVERALTDTPGGNEFSEKILGLENVRVFIGEKRG
jgi:3'-5' exoribonuclease